MVHRGAIALIMGNGKYSQFLLLMKYNQSDLIADEE
jgi:hypothetical protein